MPAVCFPKPEVVMTQPSVYLYHIAFSLKFLSDMWDFTKCP